MQQRNSSVRLSVLIGFVLTALSHVHAQTGEAVGRAGGQDELCYRRSVDQQGLVQAMNLTSRHFVSLPRKSVQRW